jgi:hypothetical protein
MDEEDTLRGKARAALQSGRIPNRRPDGTWGRPGAGAHCAVCDLPVRRHEMELEVYFASNGDDASLGEVHVHIRCFAVWESERRSSAS